MAQATESGWAWPFQDAMGVALMLLILRQFQLPSVKARCLLCKRPCPLGACASAIGHCTVRDA